MKLKRDVLVDAIYQVLPSTTARDVARAVSTSLDRPVTTGMVESALNHLRNNASYYGWTVPPVKHGVPGFLEYNRMFAVPFVREADDVMLDDNSQQHMQNGTVSALTSSSSMLNQQSVALRAASQLVHSDSEKKKIIEACLDMDYLSRKLESAAQAVAA